MNAMTNLFSMCRLDCCGCCSECQTGQQENGTIVAKKMVLDLEKRMNLQCI